MPGKRKRGSKTQRAPRGSCGYLKSGMCDLDVPVILSKNKGCSNSNSTRANAIMGKTPSAPWRGCVKEQLAIMERLEKTGYSVIALSHIVHGGNMSDSDHADKAIPDEMFPPRSQVKGTGKGAGEETGRAAENSDANAKGVKKMKVGSGNTNTKLKVLKRLNVVIEQESDLAFFNYNSTKCKSVLQSYDIIAFSPRNETVLSAICNSTSQHLFYLDIITLDYTAGRGGVQLPFRLKPTHVASASKQGLALELPYGPAIIDPSKRKGFVQAARQLMNACFKVRNVKPPPKIIVSSGCRILNGTGRDYGAMVLRSAGDILNFCKVVLGFEDQLAHRVMSSDAWLAVQKGKDRKNGKYAGSALDSGSDGGQRGIATVTFQMAEEEESDYNDDDHKEDDHSDEQQSANGKSRHVEIESEKDASDNSDDGDGFLRL